MPARTGAREIGGKSTSQSSSTVARAIDGVAKNEEALQIVESALFPNSQGRQILAIGKVDGSLVHDPDTPVKHLVQGAVYISGVELDAATAF